MADRKGKGKVEETGAEAQRKALANLAEYERRQAAQQAQERSQKRPEDSSMILPIKKRWADEGSAKEEPPPPPPNVVGSGDEVPREKTSGQEDYKLKGKMPVENAGDQQLEDEEDEDDDDDEELPELDFSQDPRTLRRTLPNDYICISKTLSSHEVVPHNAMLLLDAFEAAILSDCPEFVDEPPPNSFSKRLLVYDPYDASYLMILNHFLHKGKISYCISAGWSLFVMANRLKAGDEISIYKLLDTRVSDEPYFVIKYFRKPPDRTPVVGRGTRKRKRGDGDQKDDPKHGYRLESRHKDTGGLVIKMARK